jgi:hypothetical protein
MSTPKHILLVTNAVTETELSLIHDAMNQAKKDGMPIKLSLVHVIPNLPTCYFNIPSMVMLAERYYEEAKNCLATIGSNLEITKENQWLITGRIKNEVLRLADKLDAHFILASSPNIQDFHKSFTFKFKKEQNPAVVKSISAITSL